MLSCDTLVVGGGVVGLTVALELKRRCKNCKVILIEKEPGCGLHTSGRNSGVLHAGFYYSADSLKARFTQIGNERMTSYCLSKGLKINRCGKLVVAKNESELTGLDELKRRADKNGVELKEISEQQAKQIEPRVKTHKKALFSPATSTIDCRELMEALKTDAKEAGIEIITGCKFLDVINNKIKTSTQEIKANYVINTAGLYADQVASKFGFSSQYKILPFKGLYLKSREKPGSLKTNIYPVPNLKNPFLGTHFTVTADGRIKLGPTAIPALWREQYSLIKGINPAEMLEIALTELSLFFKAGFDFRGLALQEIKKYYRPYLIKQGAELLEGVTPDLYREYGPPGIRAQLLDKKTRTLVMDFVLEGDEKSLHVLNAVSPALTCSFPFAEYVCDEMEKLRR